jgi:hypothetical protein
VKKVETAQTIIRWFYQILQHITALRPALPKKVSNFFVNVPIIEIGGENMTQENSCVRQARRDIAEIVNRHAQMLLDYQARDLPWNIERRQIVIDTLEGANEMATAAGRCPGYLRNDYDHYDDAHELLIQNGFSAYKDTLYLHETFKGSDFWAETNPYPYILKNSSEKWSDFISSLKFQFIRGLAVTTLIWAAKNFLCATVAGLSIVAEAIQAGSFIYMKATNPDLQFMTVE